MRTLLAEWRDYRRAVVPAGASDVQADETRRAFYAGAHAAIYLLMSMSDDDTVADLQAEALLAEVVGILADLRLPGRVPE